MKQLFGLLVYNNTDNLGDEVQSLAARRFLPSIDYQFDRDSIKFDGVSDANDVRLIMNGWFLIQRPDTVWPPNERINPLITSFHVTPGASGLIFSANGIQFLKQHAPIGCRDLYTLGLLKRHGVDSYFSACMTLTLNRPEVARDDNLIVANDVPDAVLSSFAGQTAKKFTRTTHGSFKDPNIKNRFEKAEELLKLYAQASCVLTTKLHCALPCVAMGTPVLLINQATDTERFFGLSSFVFNCSPNDLISKRFYYDLNAPMPNPSTYVEYRKEMIRLVTEFISSGRNTH